MKQNLLPHRQKEKPYRFQHEWKANIEGIKVDISELLVHVSMHTDKA